MKKIIQLSEGDLIKLVKRVINESEQNEDEIINFIKQKFRGLKREDGAWYIKGEEVLQYSNRAFLIKEDIFFDVMEHFNLTEKETKKYFIKYLDKKFPNSRYVDVFPERFPKF
jgi:hypothetical protein